MLRLLSRTRRFIADVPNRRRAVPIACTARRTGSLPLSGHTVAQHDSDHMATPLRIRLRPTVTTATATPKLPNKDSHLTDLHPTGENSADPPQGGSTTPSMKTDGTHGNRENELRDSEPMPHRLPEATQQQQHLRVHTTHSKVPTTLNPSACTYHSVKTTPTHPKPMRAIDRPDAHRHRTSGRSHGTTSGNRHNSPLASKRPPIRQHKPSPQLPTPIRTLGQHLHLRKCASADARRDLTSRRNRKSHGRTKAADVPTPRLP